MKRKIASRKVRGHLLSIPEPAAFQPLESRLLLSGGTGTPPAAPQNFTAEPLAYDTIRLTWDDLADNETSYEIMRYNQDPASSDSQQVPLGPLVANSTSFTDSNGVVPSRSSTPPTAAPSNTSALRDLTCIPR